MTPYYTDEKAGIVLYHGDCRDILPMLDAVDHVITDPPYSEHVHSKQWIGHALTAAGGPRMSTAHSGLGFEHLTASLRQQILESLQVRRWLLAFSDLEGITGWQSDVASVGLEYVRTCIWDKVDSAPQFTGDRPANSAEAIVVAHPSGRKRWNGGGRRNIFRHGVNGERGPKPHPSQKPLSLMLELVSLFTDPGDLVLDPFMGSGTTGVACKQLGRRFIGIELEEKWCAVAKRRIQNTEYKPPLFDWEPERGEQLKLGDPA